MDQLNMNNIKHHEKNNTHTQRTKSNTKQKDLAYYFFQKGSMSGHVNYVGHDYILFNCTLA